MRVALVTDAWRPQVNGVVTTYANVTRELAALGHEVLLVTPDQFRTVPCPTYPSIRLAVLPGRAVARLLEAFDPDAIHVATEGPLGLAGRAWCSRRGRAFTTCFHTQLPEYVRLRAPVPLALTYALVRRFHGAAARTLVPTESQRRRLEVRGFRNLALWARGVDTAVFRPRAKTALEAPRPIAMYLGRVAVEKNIAAFLELDLPGTKVVVGDGPDLPALRARYPAARFLGQHMGEALAERLAAADVLVFPSRTDTFGLVLLEAMACGVPVAAYPVTGPVDVIRNGVTGILHDDLRLATLAALRLDPRACIEYAMQRSWRGVAAGFVGHLAVRAG